MALTRESGVASVPPTIQAVLSARIERLGEAERVVLECGAVEGEVFHEAAASALAHESNVDVEAALNELVRKELIRPDRGQIGDGDAYRFSHLLIREAAYDALPKARRANLHDEMAELIVGNAPRPPGRPSIYAAAYRPFRRGEEAKVSTWPVTLAVGELLPVLPLWLREVEGPVRVDLEAAYTEARQRSALA